MDKRIIIKKWTYKKYYKVGIKYLMECLMCHKQFEISAKLYNKGNGKYCSQKCYHRFNIPWNKGTKGIMKANSGSFKKGQLKEKCINWKGGKIKDKNNYIFIHFPNHPYCNSNNYIREHRLVAEKKLGRYLIYKETIHHINEIKNDNRPENLYLFPTNASHVGYHQLVKNNLIKPITKSNLKAPSNAPKFELL